VILDSAGVLVAWEQGQQGSGTYAGVEGSGRGLVGERRGGLRHFRRAAYLGIRSRDMASPEPRLGLGRY